MKLPYKFVPRDYQIDLWNSLADGYKRAIIVWHRRSGKDLVSFNYMVKEAMKKVAQYYYFFPTYAQGKKVLWDGLDTKTGFRFLDHIPKQLVKRTDNTSMLVELVNGSIIQVVGTDNYNSILGTNPYGCVFSEYSLQDPRAWQFIRPILAANDGWAIFNLTPRGHNHARELYDIARLDTKTWFNQVLTVDDTKAIPKEVLDKEKSEMSIQTGNDALFLQEYYCSFDVPIEGAYYASQLLKAEEEKRITNIPCEEAIPVYTFWDLGVGDATAIWFVQKVGREFRVIDYYETTGEGLGHYIKILKEKGYVYDSHYAPFDIEVRELSSGKSRLEIARSLGIDFRITPRLSLEDGINAARMVFNQCWFDKEKCDRGLSALKSYSKEYDDANKIYKDRPKHDWSSHGADAFRYFAINQKSLGIDTATDLEYEQLEYEEKKKFGGGWY